MTSESGFFGSRHENVVAVTRMIMGFAVAGISLSSISGVVKVLLGLI